MSISIHTFKKECQHNFISCQKLELNTIYETNNWLNERIFSLTGIQLQDNNSHFEIQYAAELKSSSFKNH